MTKQTIADPDVQLDEAKVTLGASAGRARTLCARAKAHEERGDYEAGRSALRPFWTDIDACPIVSELDDHTRALLLLRCGALMGYIGRANRIPNSQERAKDLITASSVIFERLDSVLDYVETQSELVVCYRHTGAHNEARIVAESALKMLDESNIVSARSRGLRAELSIRAALVETYAFRFEAALDLLDRAQAFVDQSHSFFLNGRFHAAYGATLRYLAGRESMARTERLRLTERARREFNRAIHYFQIAGHARYIAHMENNLGWVCLTLKDYIAAHKHLDKSLMILSRLNDVGTAASVLESKARVYLAEEKYEEAKRTAYEAVSAFDGGEERAELCEAFVTYAIAFGRSGEVSKSYATFIRAADAAEYAGHMEAAGCALLTLIEELHPTLPVTTLGEAYKRADLLLARTTNEEFLRRVRCVAALIINHAVQSGCRNSEAAEANYSSSTEELPTQVNLSFDEAMSLYEFNLLKSAIMASRSKLLGAAELLGMSHQRLSAMIKTRHPELLSLFKKRKRRQASLIPDEVKSTFRRSYRRKKIMV